LDLDKKDLLAMAVFSILYFMLSNYNLGAHQIPVTPWEPPGPGSVVFDLHRPRVVSSLYVLAGGADPIRFQILCGRPDDWTYVASFEGAGYYRWGKADIDGTTRFIALSFSGRTGKINEVLMTGAGGEAIDMEGVDIWFDGTDGYGVTNLVDEQGAVEFPPTRFSQAYFDEVYYVRAAEEYLGMREVYESTHPPLGKLLITSGILLFGFNPYGWRVVVSSFSTLMVPLIYVFSKAVFRSRTAAVFSASLLSLDFMHFTMGRIATTEMFAVFFNLASCLFFYINYRSLLEGGKLHGSSVFLGSVFFALGFSTKWYTIFGLMGQLFLMLMVIFRAWRRREKTSMVEVRPLLLRLASILLISLLVCVAIYFSTFIPHMLRGHDLRDVYALQWRMLRYHSTLKEIHPFSSPWWSWPVIQRPLWLTVDALRGGLVSTVVAMGNPLIWWAGTFFVASAAERAMKKRDDTCIFIAVTFLFQWLPFALIRRCLFIYHFYIDVPILILATTYFLNESWRDGRRRKLIVTYLTAAAVAFAFFYPVISGQPIPDQYRALLRWLPGWVF